MITPDSHHTRVHISKDSSDIFFGPDDLGRTFLTPSSSDASNLLLLSRTPFKHTRITPPQKYDERQENANNGNNPGENLICEDEELLFFNTMNPIDSDEDVTAQTAIANQSHYDINYSYGQPGIFTGSYTGERQLIPLPLLRNEPKSTRHNHVPLLEPNIFDSVDAKLYENIVSHTTIKDFTLNMEKILLDRFAMREDIDIEDDKDANSDTHEYRDEDEYIYNFQVSAGGKKRKKIKKTNDAAKRNQNFLIRQTTPIIIDTRADVNPYSFPHDHNHTTTGNSRLNDHKSDHIDTIAQFVKCLKHKECRKPNKHVGRCKFVYDK